MTRDTPHRGKQVTTAEFRRMWYDQSMTVADIARALDICTRSVWQRARHRGLPPRTTFIKPGPAATLDADAEAMWQACVCADDVAAAYGITASAVHMHMHRRRIRRGRPVNRWHKAITIAEYRALQLRLALAASARETAAAMRDAEMIDNFQVARWAGRKAA